MKKNWLLDNRAIWFFFAGAILFYILIHYLILGYTTWDGFVYRIPPIVEYIQFKELEGSKFYSTYPQVIKSFLGYVHYPFLAFWGLKGLYFSFSTTLLPLTLFAVFNFIKEFSNNHRWAIFGTIVFLSIPFVNEQPFSGYIDFAVIGAMSFYLWVLLRVIRMEKVCWHNLLSLFLSTLLFSFTRQQAPYLAIIFLVGFSYMYLGTRKPDCLDLKKGLLFSAVVLLALSPSFVSQIWKWIEHGSPIYPYQLKVFGLSTSQGFPLDKVLQGAGLSETSVNGYLKAAVHSWIFPNSLPNNFYDSRSFGAGFLFYVFVFSLFLFHKYDRNQKIVLYVLLGSSIFARDFWLPRYAYGLILIMCIQIGGAINWLLARRKWLPFLLIFIVVAVQLFGRPSYTLGVMSRDDGWYVRSNFAESQWFLEKGTTRIDVYPDANAKIILVSAANEFYLPLYGYKLTNEIVNGEYHTLRTGSCDDVFEVYSTLSSSLQEDILLVIVDQENFIAERCELECVWDGKYGCLAFQP